MYSNIFTIELTVVKEMNTSNIDLVESESPLFVDGKIYRRYLLSEDPAQSFIEPSVYRYWVYDIKSDISFTTNNKRSLQQFSDLLIFYSYLGVNSPCFVFVDENKSIEIPQGVALKFDGETRIYEVENEVFNVYRLYGEWRLGVEQTSKARGLEYGYLRISDGSFVAKLPDKLKDIIMPLSTPNVALSFDLFTLVIFEDQYLQKNGIQLLPSNKLYVVSLEYNGKVNESLVLYQFPNVESSKVLELNYPSNLKVYKAENYEITTGCEDFWYLVKYEDTEGWCFGKDLVIEGMNWEERKSLRGQYVTEDSLISLIVKETNKDLAAINDSRVRIRSEPNLKCETLDYVNKGDSVKILDRSTDKQQIGDMNDYWYNVELQNGTKGWVYGAYIDSL